jgi:hypothetical protein
MKPTKSYTMTSTNPKMGKGSLDSLPKYEGGGLVVSGNARGKRRKADMDLNLSIPVSGRVRAEVGGYDSRERAGGRTYKSRGMTNLGVSYETPGGTSISLRREYEPMDLPPMADRRPLPGETRGSRGKPITSVSITKGF